MKKPVSGGVFPLVLGMLLLASGCDGGTRREPVEAEGEREAVETSASSKGGEQPVLEKRLRWTWEDGDPSYEASGKVKPDVFLFVFDTLRRDHVDTYRDEGGMTPFMSELASKGVVYENAYATSSWTVPSMYSIITGVYPREHGVDEGVAQVGKVVGQESLSAKAYTLAERLKDRGYTTQGICTNQHLAGRFGFGQGFDRVVGSGFLKLPFPEFAVRALEDPGDGTPRFHWVHYFDPHFPYRVNQPWFSRFNESGFDSIEEISLDCAARDYRRLRSLGENAPIPPEDISLVYKRSRFLRAGHPQVFMEQAAGANRRVEKSYLDFMKAAYASEVARADDSLRRVWGKLNVGPEDLVIIVSDHGEEFMERGGIGHRWLGSLHDELVKIPLIVLYPGRRVVGRSDDLVSLVDLLPTIMALTGEPMEADECSGLPLPLPGDDKRAERSVFGELLEPGTEKRFVIRYPWKYVHDFAAGRAALFNLRKDPGEEKNLLDVHKQQAKGLEAELLSWVERAELRWPKGAVQSLSPAEVERLRAMGYMQ